MGKAAISKSDGKDFQVLDFVGAITEEVVKSEESDEWQPTFGPHGGSIVFSVFSNGCSLHLLRSAEVSLEIVDGAR